MPVIGIFTEDFHFFYELVRRLKERGEPFVSIGLRGEVPPGVGVVITTAAERKRLYFSDVVTEKDPERAIDVAKCMLVGGTKYHTIIIGIDPGKNGGVAVTVKEIQREGMPVKVLVVRTNEEREIALQTISTIEKTK